MELSAFYLKSPLSYNDTLDDENRAYVAAIERELGAPLRFRAFSEMGSGDLPLVFVGTGGTEGAFKAGYDVVQGPCFLLTSGYNNSLAASMEILSYLKARGRQGEIIHGPVAEVARRIERLTRVFEAKRRLRGMRLGAVGAPSDWLIASDVDRGLLRERGGIEVADIAIAELMAEIDKRSYEKNEHTEALLAKGYDRAEMDKALWIYGALKRIAARHALSGMSVRCFDLLGTVKSTSCLALAILNAEGIFGGCEGDMQSLIAMAVLGTLAQRPVFMCNPSRVDPVSGEMVLAHCTLPLNMPERYSLTTHFESGIGVAVAGDIPLGEATLFKCSGDFSRFFAAEVNITESLRERNLCRTQIKIRMPEGVADYFLTTPIGNHHTVCTGSFVPLLDEFFRWE